MRDATPVDYDAVRAEEDDLRRFIATLAEVGPVLDAGTEAAVDVPDGIFCPNLVDLETPICEIESFEAETLPVNVLLVDGAASISSDPSPSRVTISVSAEFFTNVNQPPICTSATSRPRIGTPSTALITLGFLPLTILARSPGLI